MVADLLSTSSAWAVSEQSISNVELGESKSTAPDILCQSAYLIVHCCSAVARHVKQTSESIQGGAGASSMPPKLARQWLGGSWCEESFWPQQGMLPLERHLELFRGFKSPSSSEILEFLGELEKSNYSLLLTLRYVVIT